MNTGAHRYHSVTALVSNGHHTLAPKAVASQEESTGQTVMRTRVVTFQSTNGPQLNRAHSEASPGQPSPDLVEMPPLVKGAFV